MVLFRRDVPIVEKDWKVYVEGHEDRNVVIRLVRVGIEEITIKMPLDVVEDFVRILKEKLEGTSHI